MTSIMFDDLPNEIKYIIFGKIIYDINKDNFKYLLSLRTISTIFNSYFNRDNLSRMLIEKYYSKNINTFENFLLIITNRFMFNKQSFDILLNNKDLIDFFYCKFKPYIKFIHDDVYMKLNFKKFTIEYDQISDDIYDLEETNFYNELEILLNSSGFYLTIHRKQYAVIGFTITHHI